MRGHHERLMERHPSVGAHRNIGLFGILELVRDREAFEPLAPFNGTSPEMKAVGRFLREHGLFAMTRWNTIGAIPPLIISEDELAQAYDIIDAALDLADEGVRA
jgi:taurine--2-oxoglutarate transaminase